MNKPLKEFKGAEVPSFSLESSDPEVVIDTLKKSYSGSNIAVRMYENSGESRETELKVPFAYDEVLETDLLENNGSQVDVRKLRFAPYEIKTLLFINPHL